VSAEASELEALADRLGELARGLRETELGEERALELSREAAELATRAGAAVEAALRALEERSASDAEPDPPG
jgi:hypothetical protein